MHSNKILIKSINLEETKQIASKIAALIKKKIVRTLYFKGNIGAGKTTLIRYILKDLGVSEIIKSPTFSIIENYDTDLFEIFHMDFFRFTNPTVWRSEETRSIFENKDCLIFLEWPEKASYLPKPDIFIEISWDLSNNQNDLRVINIKGSNIINTFK